MKILNLLTALLFISINTNAQWTTNTDVNTEVVSYEGENQDIKSVSLDSGRTAIVFWKALESAVNYELRLQIMDADGNKELGVDGSLISNTIPMSTFVNYWSLIVDEYYNMYIGVTGTDGAIGFAFKLSKQGVHLWPSDGVNLGSGYSVTILPLSDGNTIVSWMSETTYTSYIQKFDINGDAVWSENLLTDPNGYTVPAALFELSNGDVVSIYHQRGTGVNSTLFSQRYTEDGSYVWSEPTQVSTTTTAYNYIYSPAQNLDTLYFGYIGKTGVRFDSFIQRINPDGSLPWGSDGLDFDINQTDFEMDTRIAIEGDSDYLWAVCTYKNTSQTESGEYVQKINMIEGARMLTENAKQLYAIGTDYTHSGELFVYDDNPIFALEKGANDGVSPTLIDVVQLTNDGDFAWVEESKPIATNANTNKGQAQLNELFNGQAVVIFVENKGTGENSKIYAQNLIDEVTSINNIGDNKIDNIKYTNPVIESLTIHSDKEILSVSITDISGRVIIKEQNIHNKDFRLSTNAWENGLYIVTVNSTESFKIIKK